MWLEKISIRKFIGVNLAGLSFFAAVVIPQSQGAASSWVTYLDTKETYVEVVPTKTKFHWPLQKFGISQFFSLTHPGMDLPDPAGTEVYPVAAGKVTWITVLPWGYGRHIIVTHSPTEESLYAHLSKVNVSVGDYVTKDTKLGEVGSTGWSTGNHLHLEIHENSIPINPLEVLPELQNVTSIESPIISD